jgi:uncharacterized protein (DUF433 family)
MAKPTTPVEQTVAVPSVVYKTSKDSPGVVPPAGTPERAIYMQSFRKTPGLVEEPVEQVRTGEQVEREIVEAYQSGESPTDIYARFGIKTHKLYDALKRAGVSPRRFDPTAPGPRRKTGGRRQLLSDEQEAEVAELYRSGVTRKEILETYALAEGTLYRILHKYNVPINSDLKQRKELTAQALGTPEPTYPTPEPTPEPEAQPVTEMHIVPREQLPQNGYAPQAAYSPGPRQWYVTYAVRRTHIVTAESMDQAVAQLREHEGSDIDIEAVVRR